MNRQKISNPHQGQPLLVRGLPLGSAKNAMILVHGRGATAESILELSTLFDEPDFTYLAPQAEGNSWYPFSFLSPLAQNEPGISSAMAVLTQLFEKLEASGVSCSKTLLLGFSQGACVSLEYTARHARRYGGVAGLSGGLIGPEGTPRNYNGSLDRTPVFLGCSETDFHIPKERVHHTAAVFRGLKADVTERLYPDLGHAVNQDEIDFIKGMMQSIANGS
jgi:phospholipase/carboxylesterase